MLVFPNTALQLRHRNAFARLYQSRRVLAFWLLQFGHCLSIAGAADLLVDGVGLFAGVGVAC